MNYHKIEPIFVCTGVAFVLPMFEDGSIDYEGYKRQVHRIIHGGVKAILVNGTTAEPATIDIEDEFELTKITVEMAKGTGVKVIVGAGSNYTAQAIRKAKFNAEAGADANLVVTPYYNKTSQRGLIEHYKAVAAASDLPLIMYNVPGRTGMKISVDTVVELAKVPNIVAMKDATDDIAYAMEVLTRTKDMDFDLYSGCDDNILPFIAAGGKGVISVLSNVAPKQTHDICATFAAGDVAKAAQLQFKALELVDALFCEVNPIPVKHALNLMGWDRGPLRIPLCEMEEANLERLKKAMVNYGIL